VGGKISISRQKVQSFFILSRPVNVFIAMLSIFIAAFISGGLHPFMNVLAACVSGGLVTAGANAINDYFDLEIDRINKPQRPLPSGRMSKNEALAFTIVSYIIANGIAASIGFPAVMICAIFSFLLYLYSAIFKGTVLFGNLIVSLATGVAFIYGGLAVGSYRMALVPAVFAFLMHLGRELIKDMEDVEGDAVNGARTLPVVYGLLPAKIIASSIFFILFMATLVPYFLNIYGKWYLFIVVLGVNTILVFTTFSMWILPKQENFRRLSALLKADMLVGLVAIYAGRW